MNCLYCKTPLRGFLDARIVNVNGKRILACTDLAACNARKAAQERERVAGVQK